jgi:hypothetical protein
MTTNVVSELGDKWWPLPPEKFFTAQRAPDMWFGDELPPTYQDAMRSPLVTQSKFMVAAQIRQNLAQHAQRQAIEDQKRRYAHARARVGGRKRN